MQRETQACNHVRSRVPLLGYRKLLKAPTGTAVEGREFCRSAELLSPPLAPAAGEAVSLTPSRGCWPGAAPTCPTRSGAALRPDAGWVPRDPTPGTSSLFMPLWSLYGNLYPPGQGKIRAWHSPTHVAAGLRTPNSSQQWWRIANHTQSPTCPCSAQSLSPAALTPPRVPGEQPRENPRTNTSHPLGPAWGYTCPPPSNGETWVMGVP